MKSEPAVMACVDETRLCDSNRKQCQHLPPDRAQINFVHGTDTKLSKAYLGRLILSTVLSASAISEYSGPLDATEHCTLNECGSLPREQWKVEARRVFETSLARIQMMFLDIVRGVEQPPGYTPHLKFDSHNISDFRYHFQRLPPGYHDICHMGKFKATGWRNVSGGGFFGLLILAATVSVGSIKSKDDELWLALGARHIILGMLWTVKKLTTISWRDLWLHSFCFEFIRGKVQRLLPGRTLNSIIVMIKGGSKRSDCARA